MKLKKLLKHYNGFFTVYYDIFGSDIDIAIATHETPASEMKKLLNKKVTRFTEGNYCIEIFVKGNKKGS